MPNNINDDEKAQTVGEILRNARTKQGKDLRSVADALCIRTTYLEAIENMDLKNIPEPPYGIGFIRSYAEYLGLNGERIISSYKQTVHGITAQNNPNPEQKKSSSKPKFRHVILGILGLLGAIYVWSQWPLYQNTDTVEDFENYYDSSDEQKALPTPPLIDETAEITPIEPQAIAPAESDDNLSESKNALEAEAQTAPSDTTSDEPTVEKKNEVKMVIIGPTWVELKVAGRTVFSKTLPKDFEYVIENAEDTTITAGRYKNVKFFIDDDEIEVVTENRRQNVALYKFIKKEN